LQPADIDALAAALGVALPRELRGLLERTAQIEGTAVGTIDLTGATMDYEDRDLFPAGLPIAHDGAGNFWVLDLVPDAETAAVLFASHDPPLAVYVSGGLAPFLERVSAGEVPPQTVTPVPTLSHDEALAGDAELRAFASGLDDRFVFGDLRDAEPGAAFEWGSFGPRTEVRRAGFSRVFACAPPAQKAERRRLFGRRR